MNGKCPCCGKEGELEASCPTCPGFWYEAYTFEIVLSPCKVKHYKESNIMFCCDFAMANHVNRSDRCRSLSLGFHSDNRERFQKIWGKPHFYFRGEFYFHGWRFNVTVDGKTEEVYILTSSRKGTCIDRTTKHSEVNNIAPLSFDIALADWYEKILVENPKDCDQENA